MNIRKGNHDLIEHRVLGRSLEKGINEKDLHSPRPISELELKCSPRLPYGKILSFN